MRDLRLHPVAEVVLLGAHCDDIAIGVGATLLRLAEANPGVRVHTLVLTGGGTVREQEERRALTLLTPGAELEQQVLDLPDGRTPAHWGAAKEALQDLSRRTSPDLVFAPHRRDAHQDHRLVAELAPTAFRDRLILGYEILKWEGDLGSPALLHGVSEAAAERKVAVLQECFGSQAGHGWFDREAFLGLMRIRGAQSGERYAEAFVAEKLTLALGSPPPEP
ncbi:MAG: hypothetical protein JWP61_2452 [Friedmanniella sp.]|nr:hypothetical protein [Friedmanniella sp.]